MLSLQMASKLTLTRSRLSKRYQPQLDIKELQSFIALAITISGLFLDSRSSQNHSTNCRGRVFFSSGRCHILTLVPMQIIRTWHRCRPTPGHWRCFISIATQWHWACDSLRESFFEWAGKELLRDSIRDARSDKLYGPSSLLLVRTKIAPKDW